MVGMPLGTQLVDHVGKTFGQWTVISRGERIGYWKCRCSCGTERDVVSQSLTGGRSKGCGHDKGSGNRPGAQRNYIGERYGKLVVTERLPGYPPSFRTKCDCGTEKTVAGSNLFSGRTLSCGCIVAERREARQEQLVGETNGMLTVIEDLGVQDYGRQRGRLLVCKCGCGRTTKVMASRILDMSAKSCGCLRRALASDIQKAANPKDNLKGQVFNGWVVGDWSHRTQWCQNYWNIYCQGCGKAKKAAAFYLKQGKQGACKCR